MPQATATTGSAGSFRTVLVTGLGGTAGRSLEARLGRDGVRIVGWDRGAVRIDRYDAMDGFVADTAPDVVVHLAIASAPTGRANEAWLVNYEWPSELAWICRQRGIRFVHASTVMVFSGSATGPFTVASVPDAHEGYGHDKRRAEERVRHQNPEAVIVRLGWQIGERPGANHMIDFFERETRARGHVRASSRWLPACSFLDDTADAIARLLAAAPGCYQIDGNARWTFFEIARALSARHHGRWPIVETDDVVQDQRMIDPRVQVTPLDVRLPSVLEAAHQTRYKPPRTRAPPAKLVAKRRRSDRASAIPAESSFRSSLDERAQEAPATPRGPCSCSLWQRRSVGRTPGP